MKIDQKSFEEGYKKGYEEAMTAIIEKILDMAEGKEGNDDQGEYSADSGTK